MASAKWRRLQCLALALVLGLAVQCSFADAVNPAFKLVDRKLAQCGVIIEHYAVSEQDRERYRNSDDGTDQYWLSDQGNPSQRALLFAFNRAAEVIISPDGSRLIINSHPVSDHSDIELYQRVDKIHYKPVESADFTRPLWEFYLKENGLWDDYLAKRRDSQEANHKKEPQFIVPFDHAYIDCVALSHDSSAFMVRMLGYNGSPRHSHDWYCIYDLKINRPTLNLRIMNCDAVQLKHVDE